MRNTLLLRIYVTVFIAFLLFYYLYTLETPFAGLTFSEILASSILLLSGLLIEGLIVLFLMGFIAHSRYFFWLGYLVLLVYVGINLLQIISLEISSDFVTKLALGNTEFTGLLVTRDNILIVSIVFLVFVLLPLILSIGMIKSGILNTSSKSQYRPVRSLFLFALSIILFAILINNAKYWLPADAIANHSKFLRQNALQRLKPVDQFIRLFRGEPASELFPSLSTADIKELHKYGFPIAPEKRFPLLRNKIYDSPPPFARDKTQEPNVILIFTEGFSARTSSVYSEKFQDLTPNLNAFSRESMRVTNYYNHTAATYRGLLGGLCSLFPKYGALGGWLDSFEDIPKTNYQCLTDIFGGNGYTTYYLDPHFRDTSGLDEMMHQLKFDQVMNAEHLLQEYLENEASLRPGWLSDTQMYRSLVELLKKQDQDNPFFLTMYSVETHAWVDVVDHGSRYPGGKRNVLNTIHNMDKAFGYFWDYYKHSDYASNTIIIFTSDHGHYYSRPYLKLMEAYEENDYQKLFVDKIPLIIHDPTSVLPGHFNANNTSSIDLAPSIIHMLGFPNQKNSFLGNSIFEPQAKAYNNLGIASYGDSSYVIDDKKIHDENNSDTRIQQLELIGRYIKYVQALEIKDRIYP